MTLREHLEAIRNRHTEHGIEDFRDAVAALRIIDNARWHHAKGDDFSDLGSTGHRLVPDPEQTT